MSFREWTAVVINSDTNIAAVLVVSFLPGRGLAWLETSGYVVLRRAVVCIIVVVMYNSSAVRRPVAIEKVTRGPSNITQYLRFVFFIPQSKRSISRVGTAGSHTSNTRAAHAKHGLRQARQLSSCVTPNPYSYIQ